MVVKGVFYFLKFNKIILYFAKFVLHTNINRCYNSDMRTTKKKKKKKKKHEDVYLQMHKLQKKSETDPKIRLEN